MKKLIIIIICMFFISCNNDEEKPKHMEGDTFKTTNIRYIKDTRTNICFAEVGYIHDYSFTTVDCEKVEKLIKENE